MSALLNLQNLSVRFGTKEVVRGMNLSIQPGEKLALVGESGSGKTITALSILQLVQGAALQGQCLFEGRDLLQCSEREMRGIRGGDIAMIFQEPMTALNPLMTIGAQIEEVLALKQAMLPKERVDETLRLLTSVGIPEPERRARSYPHQLSGGQRQRAMIAMALACRPKLLLADEPTTALDVTLRGQILDLLSDLQRQTGMAVLLITHDLNLVRRFADRVAVMEQGVLVEQGAMQEVFANPQHPYTQKLMHSQPERRVLEAAPKAAARVTAQALSVDYPVPLPGIRGWFKKGQFRAVHGADFELRAGQTLGVIGESGSGKSTLAQAVLGLLPFGGEIRFAFDSAPTAWQSQQADNLPLRRAVQVVFQDPFSSLSPRMTVEEIVGEGLQVHAPQLSAAERRSRVLQGLDDVGLTEAQFPNLLSRYPHEFSGGQRQRLAIARALIIEPQVLVLDEPTSALDVTIQKQVIELLQDLQAKRGLSYLLITHDVDVIRAMAHEVLVMKDGQVVEKGETLTLLSQAQHPYTQTLMRAIAID
jgi:microcin C transport system ATP-binding protein